LEYAESIVASARLYALALELVREQPELAYQLLISSVETIANAVLRDFEPDDDIKVRHRQRVYNLATRLKLGEEAARNLAVEACRGEHWIKRKFTKFLMDNIDDSLWENDDDLFRIPREFLPRQADLQKTLGKIYDARSRATHSGHRLPVWGLCSGGPTMPWPATVELLSSDSPFPPVSWFERIVNLAIRSFWERSIAGLPPAAPEETDQRPESENPSS
jgi:hypothetical protein